jgi:hypothetical protein
MKSVLPRDVRRKTRCQQFRRHNVSSQYRSVNKSRPLGRSFVSVDMLLKLGGVPRSMKMGNIASPWCYDARSLFFASIVKTATPCDIALRFLGWSLYLSNRTRRAAAGVTAMCHKRTLAVQRASRR